MDESFEYVVVGLGALGSAAAHQLARRGHRCVGLERFELGHHRGASHDTSRILRHSYHTPEYVRLTLRRVRRLGAAGGRTSGETLVTVVGGLDLFPPDPAIPLADYVDSLSEVGVPLRAARRRRDRGPVAAVRAARGHASGSTRSGRRSCPAGRGTAVMQRLAVRDGAVLRDRSPVSALRDLGDRGVEVVTGGPDVPLPGRGGLRGRLDRRRCWPRWASGSR